MLLKALRKNATPRDLESDYPSSEYSLQITAPINVTETLVVDVRIDAICLRVHVQDPSGNPVGNIPLDAFPTPT